MSRSNDTTRSSNGSSFESIENKIQSAAARIRQQRDEWYRSKQLAVERLRLAKEEREAVSASMKAAQDSLQKTLEKAGGAAAERELTELQSEVQRLQSEAMFQHNELVQKRRKFDEERVANEKAMERRKLALEQLHKVTCRRRSGMECLDTPQDASDQLSIEYKDSSVNWAKIVNRRAEAVSKATAEDRGTLFSLENLVKQYKMRFGDFETVDEEMKFNAAGDATDLEDQGEDVSGPAQESSSMIVTH